MNPFRRNIVLAGLCAGTAPVWAHGDKHAAPSKVVKEQKAWGIAGEARQVRRSVDVRMGDDMRFQPGQLTVKQGETLRLRVHNAGQQMHEYVIGTPAENAKHAELMLRFPNMAHDEPYMAHVPPGQMREIVWTFNRPGSFEFACLIAGHYQAGMKGQITVES
ncbi:MAG: cupredoxin family protein [Burkholderiaceae bacterium]|nr:cupredoxin family protein [Burkholderiaceae bacterium]